MAAQIEDLKRRIKALETNNRLSAATVSGYLRVVDSNGTRIGLIGDIGIPDPSGKPQSGFFFARPDGTAAFGFYDPYPNVDGFRPSLYVADLQGNVVMGDDGISGRGLTRPWVSVPFYPALNVTGSSGWPTTTSATFQDLMIAYHEVQHPYLRAYAQVDCEAGVTAEVQLRADDTIIGTSTVASGAFSLLYFEGEVPASFGSLSVLHFEARRTGGTATVRAQIMGAWGTGTPSA